MILVAALILVVPLAGTMVGALRIADALEQRNKMIRRHSGGNDE